MKKLLTILCLVLLSVHSYSQEVITGHVLIRDGITYHQDTNEPVTGIIQSFHENGQLRRRQNYKDGKRDGLQETFHDNGQLEVRHNYKDGKPDGLWDSFHENGQLWIRGNYKDGKQDGLTEFFDEEGNLSITFTYRNGELVKKNSNP